MLCENCGTELSNKLLCPKCQHVQCKKLRISSDPELFANLESKCKMIDENRMLPNDDCSATNTLPNTMEESDSKSTTSRLSFKMNRFAIISACFASLILVFGLFILTGRDKDVDIKDSYVELDMGETQSIESSFRITNLDSVKARILITRTTVVYRKGEKGASYESKSIGTNLAYYGSTLDGRHYICKEGNDELLVPVTNAQLTLIKTDDNIVKMKSMILVRIRKIIRQSYKSMRAL